MPDYIPSGNDAFKAWSDNLITRAGATGNGWSIPAEKVSALRAQQTAYNAAYQKITNPGTRTSADVQAHNDIRRTYEAALRVFVGEHLARNSAVSDAQRVELGINVRDREPTPRAAIDQTPFMKLSSEAGARIRVACRADEDSSRASILRGADGVELRYGIGLAAPPSSPEDCPKVKLSTAANFTLALNVADAGKRLHCYGRWINTTDETKNGPWCKLETTIITD